MTRVLIVDDREENLYFLQALLSGHGHTVETARHGAQALAMARQAAPDLIVSDLLMPVMDGYTLLRHWKADAQLERIPFVVYTATYTEAEDERLALNLGADAFIVKPAEPQDFMARIVDVQRRASASARDMPRRSLEQEKDLLEAYSVALVRKLEERTEQLEAERARLVAAQAVANVGSWEADLATGDMLWSAQTCRILDVAPPFQPSHEDFLRRVHPEDRARVATAFEQSVVQCTACRVEHRVKASDGTTRFVEQRWQVMADDQGRASRVLGTCQDITERRSLEQQLHRSRQLESLGHLTGGIAHDFNNLLTVILGNAELLAERLGHDPSLRALAETTLQAAGRGTELTHRLLAFARRQPLAPRQVDANELLGGMDTLLRRTLREDIHISYVPGAGLWTALVDPAQFESAVLNLGINAGDAMPDGGRLILATSNVELDDTYAARHDHVSAGPYVMVSVSDTGTGIAPDHLDRVFEPFFTTKPVGKGTGLGLSMVHGFVIQSGGHIRIDSEPGCGTTVTMYLPSVTHEAQRETAAAVADAASDGAEEAAGDATILLVEDDELVRRYAHDRLAALGYRVLTAADGPSALAIMHAREDIQLLLTDVVMPGGMNGRQLADAARAVRPGLKVLFSSGYTDNALLRQGLLHDDVQLLGKPYRAADLARKVREVLAAP